MVFEPGIYAESFVSADDMKETTGVFATRPTIKAIRLGRAFFNVRV